MENLTLDEVALLQGGNALKRDGIGRFRLRSLQFLTSSHGIDLKDGCLSASIGCFQGLGFIGLSDGEDLSRIGVEEDLGRRR